MNIKIAHVCIKFCIYKYNISITNLNSQPVNLENGRCIVLQAWQGHRKGIKGPSPAENPDQYYVYLMAGICDMTKNIQDLAWVRDYRWSAPKQRITKSWAIQFADSIEKKRKTHVRTHHL